MHNHRRASLLGQASDALAGFGRFGRRRPSVRIPPPEPVFAIPHVIDITAPPPDEELEERQRLRDAAAQSIGLKPLIEDVAPETVVQPQPVIVDLPPFPASYTAIAPLATLSETLPKYYPPNSLRIFALSKQWKHRQIILSVPAGRVSHLHLFKSTHAEDRELERLEINADSVVYVAEATTTFDLVHVVKVAGQDVGAHRRDWNATDDVNRTVWLLHLPTSADAQQWISRIKAAIFEQRTHRAGLPPTPANASGPEPNGDMDVMLSMRLAASPPPSAVPNSSPSSSPKQPPTPTSPSGTYAASLAPSQSERSVRSVATAPSASQRSNQGTRTRPPSSSGAKGAGTAAVAALKGLFSSHARPRSASSASVISAASSSFDGVGSGRTATPPPGDSFGHMGSILARTMSHNPTGSVASTSTSNHATLSANGHVAMSVLERRIIGHGERERVASESDASPSVVISNGDLEATRRRTVTYGLQPPPRARMTPWTELGTDEPPSDDDDDERPPLRMYALPHASASTGTAGSFGVRAPSAASNHDEGHLNGHIADRVSERSVSTGRSRASSVGNGASTSRQNSGRGRRWSTLPRRLTPPDNIPPATPSRSIPHPYAAASSSPSSNERSASRASAHSFGSNGTGKLNATGWTRGKRASGMSFQSVATSISETSSANASVGSLAMTGSGRVRTSMPPPPRPAPTTALPPAPSPSGSPNTQTSFRESRASSVSFREPVETQNASSSKSSFRESMGLGQRALRLSLMAPRPPPSGVLPPRPDEPPAAAPTPAAPTQEPPIKSVFQHRRSNSANATPSPSSSIRNSFLGAKARIGLGLDSIPGSPALPPPRGPLPPVPAASARHTSLKLKQRLRILSAPPAPHPQPPQSRARPTSAETIAVPIAPQATLASFLSISASTPSTPVTSTPILLPNGSYGTPPLGTPISEKIIHFNDASFLQMSASNASTPVISPMPAPAALENMSINEQDEPTQLVSLLPPPRRGSRQISVKDLEPRTPTPDQEEEEEAEERRDLEAEGAGPGPGKLFSLSRHGSVISLLLTTPTNPPM